MMGQVDPLGFKEPFKNFFSLFYCTLQQIKEEGANEYVLYVLAREAMAKGIIPEPFQAQFKQAVTKRNAEVLQSLLYRIKDYYSDTQAYSFG